MFIAQAFKYQYDFWRYLVGILIIIVGVFLGQVPYGIALFAEGGMDIVSMTPEEMMRVLDSNFNLFLLLLSFAAGLVALLFAVKYLHEQPILSVTTSRSKVDWSRVGFGFGIVAIFVVAVTLLDYAFSPEDYIITFDPVPFFIMLIIAVLMVPLQTSFEEYLFRGYLMQGIGTLAKNRWLPLIITSVIFGGLHFSNPEVTQMGNIIMIYYIGTGFLLGIMTLMDEGMELALGFHAGNNLVAVILVTADWTAFQSNSILKDISSPEAGWDIIAPVFLIYPIFLFIMAKKYGWKNWNEKLFGKVEKPEIVKIQEEI